MDTDGESSLCAHITYTLQDGSGKATMLKKYKTAIIWRAQQTQRNTYSNKRRKIALQPVALARRPCRGRSYVSIAHTPAAGKMHT
ncbi:hypothetical protein A0H81_07996 [Grifola frondosa]|uniref:Uncharacterized protein n=1 Tax=Grifola frondosa TaxID=5627 RepID=A0A1C7M502_GRIFR|nr:hypothetical protein A0H81_07996 [Grifola frondosa]